MDLSLGEWVKRRRRALDMTQQDLAKRAFCSIHTIRKLESADLKPSRSLAVELANALAVPAEAQDSFVRFARTPDATARENAFSAPIPAPLAQPLTANPNSSSASPSPGTGQSSAGSPSAVRYQPPAALTAALGREHDLAVISKTLRLPAARLVTLTGPPGTGKTRLSLEVAEQIKDEFENGAAFIPLAPLADPGLVKNAIAEVLNVRENVFGSLTLALRAFLQDKQLLLVLDNFEHLLGTVDASGGAEGANAALLVQDLLTHAPRLKILATSREPLHLYGEREIPISPLALPSLVPLPSVSELENYSAVQLFVERAQAVRPEFELTAQNAQPIARLCVRLDGLPLAIEMAAARIKWESPQTLLAQLTLQIQGLSVGGRDRTPRQQTLRGAIEWSYALLDDAEQRVLRHLGVFRGSFDVQAANAVCDSSVSEVLEALTEKSLIKHERSASGAPRFVLLEMIREFALSELIRAGEAEGAYERHWIYFTNLARSLEMSGFVGLSPAPVEVGTRELDNLRSALEWAIANGRVEQALTLGALLGDYWYATSTVTEGMHRLGMVLGMSTQIKPALIHLRARVRTMYAQALRMSGDFSRARPLLEDSIADWRQLGTNDTSSLNFALLNLSRLTLWQGDSETAYNSAREALDLSTAGGDEYAQGSAWRRIGEWALSKHDFAYARECLDRAVELQGRNDNHFGRGVSLLERGDIARTMQDYDRALRDYQAAFQESELAQTPFLDTRVLHRLGVTNALRGDVALGKEQVQQAMRLTLELGGSGTLALEYLALALCAALENDPQSAMRWLGIMDATLETQHMILIGPEVVEYNQTLSLVQDQANESDLQTWRDAAKKSAQENGLQLAHTPKRNTYA